MTRVAPTLQAFFTERLLAQRLASPRTVSAYRDTFVLLLRFVSERAGLAPSRLDFADLDAPTVGAFLEYLEADRHNSVRTRNARLAAVRSLFHYAALKHPEHAGSIERVLAIPQKRRRLVALCDYRRPLPAAGGGGPARGRRLQGQGHPRLAAQGGVPSGARGDGPQRHRTGKGKGRPGLDSEVPITCELLLYLEPGVGLVPRWWTGPSSDAGSATGPS